MIPTHHPLIKAGYFPGHPWNSPRIPCPPGGRSKVDLTLDLSSNDLRVAGAKAMASLLEMDTVRHRDLGFVGDFLGTGVVGIHGTLLWKVKVDK